jgi:hypothetical protein
MLLVRTITVLRSARAIIAFPSRWCRHSGAQTRWGESVESSNPRAVCWCVLGAIGRAAMHAKLFDPAKVDPFTKEEVYPGQFALLASLDRLSCALFGDRLQYVNDQLGREAAIAVLDAAILELRRA